MLVCDTSGLVAFFDASDAHHDAVQAAVEADEGPFVVSPYVLAELDYLLSTRRGVHAEPTVLYELANGAWDLASFAEEDVRAAHQLLEQYQDQAIGLADASLVVLAARYGTDRLLTLDRRHFTVVRSASGRAFTLLPGP